MAKNSPSLDMTPLVDLAFLLVTFFMLTATSRINEPVVVDPPSSISEKLLPKNVMLISIDEKGQPFYDIKNVEARKLILSRMGEKYEIAFTEEEKARFSVMTSFGLPMNQLQAYINMDNDGRDKVISVGIPHDSINNELSDWIQFGRIETAKFAKRQKEESEKNDESFIYEPLRFAIKADAKTAYYDVKEIIEIFTDRDIYRFNLITNLEERAE